MIGPDPIQSDPNSVPGAQPVVARRIAPAGLFYWSIRRELWEHRSLYIAPLAAAGLMLCGFLITLAHLSRDLRDWAELGPRRQAAELAMPYTHAGWLLMATALIVGFAYSLDALYSERRDRSMLFWKSLPVSDLTTVLAKASIPLLVLPAWVFVLTVALQLIMLVLSIIVLGASGGGVATLWGEVPFLQTACIFLYEWIVLMLWLAPIYGWLLLVSGWARRTAFLWAVLPPLAACILERITFHTRYLCTLLGERIVGFVPRAFNLASSDGAPIDPHLLPFSALTPGQFLSTPGLWLGLLAAAFMIAAAIRLRRYREPI